MHKKSRNIIIILALLLLAGIMIMQSMRQPKPGKNSGLDISIPDKEIYVEALKKKYPFIEKICFSSHVDENSKNPIEVRVTVELSYEEKENQSIKNKISKEIKNLFDILGLYNIYADEYGDKTQLSDKETQEVEAYIDSLTIEGRKTLESWNWGTTVEIVEIRYS